MTRAKRRPYDNSARAAAAQQTREKVLAATVEVFLAASRYEDITLPRIAELAGVSTQTVVLHFKTKDALVEAACRWWSPRETELRVVESGDPLEAAKRICERYATLGTPSLRVLALEESVPAVKPIVEHGRSSHRAWIERTFGPRLGTGKARERRLMELVVAYDVYTWDVLRRRLPPDDVERAMAELAQAVLARKGGRR